MTGTFERFAQQCGHLGSKFVASPYNINPRNGMKLK